MIVVGLHQIDAFKKKHSDSRKPLDRWVVLMTGCFPRHLEDLRKVFNKLDQPYEHTIFNIKGNSYRLAARIDYISKVALITHVLTHDEYMEIDWRKV